MASPGFLSPLYDYPSALSPDRYIKPSLLTSLPQRPSILSTYAGHPATSISGPKRTSPRAGLSPWDSHSRRSPLFVHDPFEEACPPLHRVSSHDHAITIQQSRDEIVEIEGLYLTDPDLIRSSPSVSDGMLQTKDGTGEKSRTRRLGGDKHQHFSTLGKDPLQARQQATSLVQTQRFTSPAGRPVRQTRSPINHLPTPSNLSNTSESRPSKRRKTESLSDFVDDVAAKRASDTSKPALRYFFLSGKRLISPIADDRNAHHTSASTDDNDTELPIIDILSALAEPAVPEAPYDLTSPNTSVSSRTNEHASSSPFKDPVVHDLTQIEVKQHAVDDTTLNGGTRAQPARKRIRPFHHDRSIEEIHDLSKSTVITAPVSESDIPIAEIIDDGRDDITSELSRKRITSPTLLLPQSNAAKMCAISTSLPVRELMEVPARQKQRLRSRMLKSCDVQLGNADEATSEDELTGPVNVKTITDRDSKGREKEATTRSRKPSAKSAPLERFSVRRLFSRLIQADDQDLELIYEPLHNVFVVAMAGELLCTESRQPIAFKVAHFHKKVLLNDPLQSLKILCYGSSDDISLGKVMIEFADRESLAGFCRHLKQMSALIGFMDASIDELERKWERSKSSAVEEASAARILSLPIDDLDKLFDAEKPRTRVDSKRRSVRDPHSLSPRRDSTSRRLKLFDLDRESPSEGLPSIKRSSDRTKTRSSRLLDKDDNVSMLVKWSKTHKIKEKGFPVVYPATGPKRTTVSIDDIERLDDGELLNDNLIDFSLRKLEADHPETKDSVYFFNTFFYNTLTTKNGKKAFNYEGVSRWTKSVDLFGYPYVLVPVNLDFHWFVVILCNLPNISRANVSLEDDAIDLEGDDTNTEEVRLLSPVVQVQSSAEPRLPAQELEQLSLDPARDELEPRASKDVVPDSEDERIAAVSRASRSVRTVDKVEIILSAAASTKPRKLKQKPVPPVKKHDPDAPLIITLDSLGKSHATVIRSLKDYITAEGNAKRALDINTKDISGLTAKGIPEQSNLSDCGVYAIGYVEAFLRNPRSFVEKVCSREMDRSNTFEGFDPSKKRAEIRETLLGLAGQEAD